MSAVEGGGADAAEEKLNDKPLATGRDGNRSNYSVSGRTGLMLMLLNVSVPTVHEIRAPSRPRTTPLHMAPLGRFLPRRLRQTPSHWQTTT